MLVFLPFMANIKTGVFLYICRRIIPYDNIRQFNTDTGKIIW